jgi:hypothetical protein
MAQILHPLVHSRLSKYRPIIHDMSRLVVTALLEFFELCTQTLLPIPSKLHYVFSLRNIVRVIKGITMADPVDTTSEPIFIRLWCHEMQREFFDRFNTEADRRRFLQVMNDLVTRMFRVAGAHSVRLTAPCSTTSQMARGSTEKSR